MKPIIFSTPMVQAILGGRKTQTRRVIKPQPKFALKKKLNGNWYQWSDNPKADDICDSEWGLRHDPHYQPGDILWLRETWQEGHDGYIFKATFPTELIDEDWRWKPSIHMPRAAARIFLWVTDVRVERVQEISEADAKAEGIKSYWLTKEHAENWHESSDPPFIGTAKELGMDLCNTRRKAYQQLWDTLNAKHGYGWDSNPWVWVIGFERVDENEV